MSKVIPKEQLTAYQRWELAAIDDEGSSRTHTTQTNGQSQVDKTAAHVVLPTAEDIERLHQEAWQEGYTLGIEEGRKAGFEPDASPVSNMRNSLTIWRKRWNWLGCAKTKSWRVRFWIWP